MLYLRFCDFPYNLAYTIRSSDRYKKYNQKRGQLKKNRLRSVHQRSQVIQTHLQQVLPGENRKVFDKTASTRSQSIDNIKSSIDTIQNDIWEGDQSINKKKIKAGFKTI